MRGAGLDASTVRHHLCLDSGPEPSGKDHDTRFGMHHDTVPHVGYAKQAYAHQVEKKEVTARTS